MSANSKKTKMFTMLGLVLSMAIMGFALPARADSINLAPQGVATANASYYYNGGPYIDYTTTPHQWEGLWLAGDHGSNGPYWLKVNLGNQYEINKIKVTLFYGGSGNTNNYNLYSSVDGAKWDFIQSGTLYNTTYEAATQTALFSNPKAIQYVKYEVVGGSDWANLLSMEIYGNVPLDPTLELLYPVGPSTKVFTRGWLFGAKCLDASGQDVSDKVEWSGTGRFQPATGSQSRPTFGGAGSNTITLTYTVGNKTVKKDFTVEAVSPDNYARVGSLAHCAADAHQCPACPHNVTGPVISGSPTVFIDGKPAARKGDPGVHVACCGPNTFVIGAGDPEVLIDGKAAARIGDRTNHCGGVGQITTSAPAGATQAVQSLLLMQQLQEQ
jgi:uncharacterized Zn-binding protein involved in type VI secretion